jgi:hypothetical protein
MIQEKAYIFAVVYKGEYLRRRAQRFMKKKV